MKFSDIIGQDHIKMHLMQSAKMGRIPHAQLFTGDNGYGVLAAAIAYSRYLLCELNLKNTSVCNIQMDKLTHPDLHFAFPVATTGSVKKDPVSDKFLSEWREFVNNTPYASLFNWYQHINIEKKQGLITVNEASDIVKKLTLKAHDGGYKIMLIWRADKLNLQASNKLLKLIEEPPKKTVFILIANHAEQVISTIRSRCQVLNFPPVSEQAIVAHLKNTLGKSEDESLQIAQQANGNVATALLLAKNKRSNEQYESWFVFWVRTAFKARGNKGVVKDLIGWSETIAKTTREEQKQFLMYCLNVFRQALLLNYSAPQLVFQEFKQEGFKLENFAPFVHNDNINTIYEEIESAIYHIERNGNSRLILTDLSIKLTRLLHKKAIN